MKSKTKRVVIIGGIVVASIVGAELFARYSLGLGDPPLSVADAEIDYIFAPNQNCRRFGNHIVYNNCSMRCDFDVVPSPAVRRIFVVGDSVVNGGVLTDHSDLATTILQEQLDPSRLRTQVCNVSAGSWGPGNYAAYFRRHGDLVGTNDVMIVEVNSHDLWEDDPLATKGANVGKDVSLPDHKPWCALYDGFNRYFMPKVRRALGLAAVNTKVDVPRWQNDVRLPSARFNLAALDAVYGLPVRSRFLLIHRSREETRNCVESLGETEFRKYAKAKGITIIELKLNATDDFRDGIHLSARGQRKMAAVIADAMKEPK